MAFLRSMRWVAGRAAVLAVVGLLLGIVGFLNSAAVSAERADQAVAVLGWAWRLLLWAGLTGTIAQVGITIAERLPEPEPQDPAEAPTPKPPVRRDPVARDPFGEWIEQQWRRLTGRAPRRRPRR